MHAWDQHEDYKIAILFAYHVPTMYNLLVGGDIA